MATAHGRYLLALVPALACSQATPSADAPGAEVAIDILAPERGSWLDDSRVTVRGRVSDPSAIDTVRVHDREVTVDDAGEFEVTFTAAPGLQLIHTVALADHQVIARDTRAVVTGPRRPATELAERSIRIHLSAEAIDELAASAGRALADADLGAAAAASPLFHTGGDCLGATARVVALDIGAADVGAQPLALAVRTEVALTDIRATIAVDYRVGCVSGQTVTTLRADAYRATATVGMTAAAGKVRSSVEIDDSDVDDLAVVLTGIDVVDSALTNVDWLAGPLLGWLLEAELGPALDAAVARVAERDMTLSLGGYALRAVARVEELELGPDGVKLHVSTAAFADGAGAPAYIATPTQSPIAAEPASYTGFDARLDDEVFHQAFTAVWSTGIMTRTVESEDLGLGDFGGALTGLSIDARLPPVVRLGEDELPRLVIADLLVGIEGPDFTHARIAISAEFELAITENGTAGESSTVLRPDIHLGSAAIDVIAIDDRSRELLDDELLAALARSALLLSAQRASDLVGLITLPRFAGTTLLEPVVRSRAGTLQLAGELGALP